MKKSIYIFTILVLLLSNQLVYSQQARFRHLKVEDGLSDNAITSIYQDTWGYLWIGTSDGLNRYDGYVIKKYYRNDFDIQSLPGNVIRDIFQDSKNRLWIGTNDGLARYIPEKDCFERYINENFESKEDQYVWDIFEDQQKIIWVGKMHSLETVDSDTKKFTSIYSREVTDSSFKQDKAFSKITQDKQGDMWFACGNLIEYNPLQNKLINHTIKPINSELPPLSNCKMLYLDSYNNLWVSTAQGVVKFNAATYQLDNNLSKARLSTSYISEFTEDLDKNVWFSSYRQAGQFLNGSHNTELYQNDSNDPYSLVDNNCTSIFVDRAGLVWIGTMSGLSKYDKHLQSFKIVRQNISKYQTELDNKKLQELIQKRDVVSLSSELSNDFQYIKTLPSNDVNQFFEDNLGRIWVTSDNGLSIWYRKYNWFKFYNSVKENPKTLQNNNCGRIFKDKKGRVWITHSNGLSLYNEFTEDFTKYDFSESSTSGIKVGVSSNLEIDDKNIFWGANRDGVFKIDIDNKVIKKYNSNNGFSTYDKRGLVFDKKGRIWVATVGSGVQVFDTVQKKVVKNYMPDETDPNSLSSIMIYTIHKDRRDRIWIGTKTGGVCLYNDKTDNFIIFREKDGLISNYIKGIIDDNNGNMWIATSRGLSHLNPQSKQITNYDISDGIVSNNLGQVAFYRSNSGEIFLGSNEGFNIFHPDSVKKNPFPPIVVITNITINNKTVETSAQGVIKKFVSDVDSLELDYSQNIFAFEFSAFHFSQPQKNKYAYKLDGFENEWVYTNADKHFASYSNIKQGEYLFRVKAANSDGVWSKSERTIYILIHPPYWETWWFRTLMVILIGGSAYTFYHIRITNIQRQKKKLEEKNIVLTSQKLQIESQTEELLSQSDNLKKANDSISKTYDNIQKISEFGQSVTATLNLASINSMIYDYVKTMMDTQVFGVGIYNPRLKQIVFQHYWIEDEKQESFSRPLTDKNSLAVWSLVHKKEIFINDYEHQIDDYITGNRTTFAKFKVNTVLYVPLILENRAIGVITVQHSNLHAYSQVDMQNIRSLSSYISIAFDNANVYELVRTKNDMINGSLRYAETIQQAILPHEEIALNFDNFIIYKPRDVVSGDFFWYHYLPENSQYFVAVVDCTGHGVPGAFMSMIGYSLLNKIVKEKGVTEPADILNELNQGVREALNQKESDNNDGMDVCLCSIRKIDTQTSEIVYSGAKRNLYVFENKNESFKFLKGNSHSIGGVRKRMESTFTQLTITLSAGDVLYLSSDGFTDQNNPNRKRMGSHLFASTIIQIAKLDMTQQREKFIELLDEHMSGTEQRDDITVVGIKI